MPGYNLLFQQSCDRWKLRIDQEYEWHLREVEAGRQSPQDWVSIYEKLEREEEEFDQRARAAAEAAEGVRVCMCVCV